MKRRVVLAILACAAAVLVGRTAPMAAGVEPSTAPDSAPAVSSAPASPSDLVSLDVDPFYDQAPIQPIGTPNCDFAPSQCRSVTCKDPSTAGKKCAHISVGVCFCGTCSGNFGCFH